MFAYLPTTHAKHVDCPCKLNCPGEQLTHARGFPVMYWPSEHAVQNVAPTYDVSELLQSLQVDDPPES